MIEPTWTSGDVSLYLGDCLEILPQLEAGSVDAVVTDPPYGIGENNKKNLSRGISTSKWRQQLAHSNDYGEFGWDKERLSEDYFIELIRVSREQIIFGGNYYTDYLRPSPSWIVWDKHNGKNDFADCELAWTSHKRAVRQVDWLWNGMIRQGNEERFHPTQKPLGVMRWILANYTKEGDLVCDPFMGSGTTGVACVQTGRKFIGIEIEPKYFEIAVKRIEQAQLQIRMEI
jgi:DNA modification methylase